MKKKALALAVASALIAPSAFAASDTSGMQYTSASEGFYGSLRARYVTSPAKDGGADIQTASSRIGVSGTGDLGGGLTGFYGWELGVGLNDGAGGNGEGLRTRLGNVGLRGDFGQVVFGSFWTFDYSATHGSTDQANTHSGYFNYTENREARSERSFQYTTPDFNGFQSALLFEFANEVDGRGVEADPDTAKDESDLDSWNLAGQYAVQGFTLGASYNVRPDALQKKTFGVTNPTAAATLALGENTGAVTDAKSWTIRGSYGQDNWNVNAWYGQDNTSDRGNLGSIGTVVADKAALGIVAPPALTDTNANAVADAVILAAGRSAINADSAANIARRTGAQTKAEDTTFLAFHAGVSVDKVNLYAIHEIRENQAKLEDTYTTLGVQYSLGAQSRTWLEYTAQDYATNPNNEDYINIGLRFDF